MKSITANQTDSEFYLNKNAEINSIVDIFPSSENPTARRTETITIKATIVFRTL